MIKMISKVHAQCLDASIDSCYNLSRSGFSVLELILALGIAAVMGSSVFMVYANAVRLESRSRELNEITFRTYMIIKTIEDDIGRSVLYRFRSADGNGEIPAFVGSSQRLAFVRQTPQGLRWVEYSLEDTTQAVIRKTALGRRYSNNEDQALEQRVLDIKSRTLIRQQSLFDSSTPGDSRKEEREIVAQGLHAQDFSFKYGKSEKNTQINWKNTWDDLELPSALRVDVRFSKGSKDALNGFSKVIILPVGS